MLRSDKAESPWSPDTGDDGDEGRASVAAFYTVLCPQIFQSTISAA